MPWVVKCLGFQCPKTGASRMKKFPNFQAIRIERKDNSIDGKALSTEGKNIAMGRKSISYKRTDNSSESNIYSLIIPMVTYFDCIYPLQSDNPMISKEIDLKNANIY